MQDAAHLTYGDAVCLFENEAATSLRYGEESLTCRHGFPCKRTRNSCDRHMSSDNGEWVDAGQPLCMHLPFFLGLLGRILGWHRGRCMLNRVLRQPEPSETTKTCPCSSDLQSIQARLGLAHRLVTFSSYSTTQRRREYHVSTWSVTFAFFRQLQARAQSACVPRPGKGGTACHSLQGISYAA